MHTLIETASIEHQLATTLRTVAQEQGTPCTIRVRAGPATEITHGSQRVTVALHRYAPESRGMWRTWAQDFLAHCLRGARPTAEAA